MIELIITALLFLYAAVRLVAYGVFTAKEKNTAGAVSLFVILAALIAVEIYMLVR